MSRLGERRLSRAPCIGQTRLELEPGLPTGYVSDTTAISIHVYGTDVTRIGSSARRYYN